MVNSTTISDSIKNVNIAKWGRMRRLKEEFFTVAPGKEV